MPTARRLAHERFWSEAECLYYDRPGGPELSQYGNAWAIVAGLDGITGEVVQQAARDEVLVLEDAHQDRPDFVAGTRRVHDVEPAAVRHGRRPAARHDLRRHGVRHVPDDEDFGPVDPVREEVVGPAGPTTATRMDGFTEMMLAKTGLISMIGKA